MVDVYVTPDYEILSFDVAESGVRTLMQNQQDDGMLGRLRASTLAHMIIQTDPPSRAHQGVPWIFVRRNVMGDSYQLHPSDNDCDVTLDIGSTTDHLNRVLEVTSGRLSHEARSRRFAAVTSPMSLPEASGSADMRSLHVYRDSDIEAVFTGDCDVNSYCKIMRLLARDQTSPGDLVEQRGIAFHTPNHIVASKVKEVHHTFDIDAYIEHIGSLKVGDLVFVMPDVPTTHISAEPLEGRVRLLEGDHVCVELANSRVLSNSDGLLRAYFDIPKIGSSDGFVYGASWVGAKFCRSLVCRHDFPLMLIPWSKSIPWSTLVTIVQPTDVHAALAKNSVGADLSSLLGTDDMPLSIQECVIMNILIRTGVENLATFPPTISPGREQTKRVTRDEDAHFLFLTGFVTSPTVALEEALPGIQSEMTGGRTKANEVTLMKHPPAFIDFTEEPCQWNPTSLLEGIVIGCIVDISGDSMASMTQGHVIDMHDFVDVSVSGLSIHVAETRGFRDQSRRADASRLTERTGEIAHTLTGATRLKQEIELSQRPFFRWHSDCFRHLDLDRWVQESVRHVPYSTFRGNEQSAFEADLAATRLGFEDRPFYRALEPILDSHVAISSPVLFATSALLDMLIDICEVRGLLPGEISAIIRNTRHYRPDEDLAIRVRKRVEMVKRAKNRPEFKEQNLKGRIALEKRLVDRVRISASRDHTIRVLDMLAALLIMIIRSGKGRVQAGNSSDKGDAYVLKAALAVHQITSALLPSERGHDDEHDTPTSHVPAIKANMKIVADDKIENGVPLVSNEDLLEGIARPRATREAPWSRFRPLMSNLSKDPKLSVFLKDVAALQHAFIVAQPLVFKTGKRPERFNVCCIYALPGLTSVSRSSRIHQSTLGHSHTSRRSKQSSHTLQLLSKPAPIVAVLEGTTAIIPVPPLAITPYSGAPQPILEMHVPFVPPIVDSVVHWREAAVRSFLDVNPVFSDVAFSVIASLQSVTGAKSAWSALSSLNIARFNEISSNADVGSANVTLIHDCLLSPMLTSDDAIIQDQQFQAKLFLRTILMPILGRLSNASELRSDLEVHRLNTILDAHEPRSDATSLRSSLATLGNIRSTSLLMLADGPLRDLDSLRASVHLLIGLCLAILWKVLGENGGGALGATIVKPLVRLALERLSKSLTFARADDHVTRLIQDQREDDKLRKIDIYNRLLPDDIDIIKDLRLIKKDFDWDQIERDYAASSESATTLARDDVTKKQLQMTVDALEIGALGTYPDDDRVVGVEDGDQEMMDYGDLQVDYVD